MLPQFAGQSTSTVDERAEQDLQRDLAASCVSVVPDLAHPALAEEGGDDSYRTTLKIGVQRPRPSHRDSGCQRV
jgi:hypothetical protein